jgi:ATP-binding cassette subfamily E protein 1
MKLFKKQGDFELTVDAGSFRSSQITVLLGENGTGKTTFIKMLAEAGKKKTKKDQGEKK